MKFIGNVIGGASANAYPAGNLAPSVAARQAGFTSFPSDARLKPDATWAGAGADVSLLPQ